MYNYTWLLYKHTIKMYLFVVIKNILDVDIAIMGRSYKPLRIELAKLFLELKDLEELIGLNYRTRKKLEQNLSVSGDVLERIISFLQNKGVSATFDSVVEYVPDHPE